MHVLIGIGLVVVIIALLPFLTHTKFGGYWSKLYVTKSVELDAQATSLQRVTDLSVGVFLGIAFSTTDFRSAFIGRMTIADVLTNSVGMFMFLFWCVGSLWLQRMPSSVMEANKTYKMEFWVFFTRSLLSFIMVGCLVYSFWIAFVLGFNLRAMPILIVLFLDLILQFLLSIVLFQRGRVLERSGPASPGS